MDRLISTYQICAEVLAESNSIDYAHQLKLFYQLLDDSNIRADITGKLRYVMVDEYQDTNYVQEQILYKTTICKTKNR